MGNKHRQPKGNAHKQAKPNTRNQEAREMPAAMVGDLGPGSEEGGLPKLDRPFYETELYRL